MTDYDSVQPTLTPPTALPHYYGDIVRKLFLLGGLIMLLALPFFNQFLPVPAFVSMLAVLVIGVIAGFTNPLQRWVMLIDIIVSLIGLAAFEYHAISQYNDIPILLFGIDQLLAIIFFFALYFSTKTLRGVTISDYTIRQHKQRTREEANQRRFPL